MKKMPISELTKEAIYSFIVKNGGTLEQLAERYACDEKKFMSFVRKKTGKGGWKNVAQCSAENAKKQKEQVNILADQARETEVEVKEKAGKENNSPKQESIFYYAIETEESLKRKKAEIKAQFNSILGYFQQSKEVSQEASNSIQMGEKEIEKAERLINEINQVIAEARKDLEEEEARQSEFEIQLKQLEKENEEIERKLSEMQEIILVAPNYQGKLPENRRLVSVTAVTEKVAIEEIAEVQITATVTELLNSGFDRIQEYAEVMQFAALCGEYKKRDTEHKILVDDERIKNIFVKLGIEE